METKKVNVLLVFSIFLIGNICTAQSISECKYQGIKKGGISENLNIESNFKKSAATDYIQVYQKYISGIRAHECPMYPSCSNYSLKLFNKLNFTSALAATAERILRCGHDIKQYPITLRENGIKLIDFPEFENIPNDIHYSKTPYYFAYSDTIPKDSSFLFVNRLINNQFFHEALLEINRLEYFNSSFNLQLFINKIICLKAIEEYEKALFEFETKCPAVYRKNVELTYQIALVQFKLKNFQIAIDINRNNISIPSDSTNIAKFLILDGLLHANLKNWDSAKHTYEVLSQIESYSNLGIINLNTIIKAQNLKNKNKTTAALLSIIPGAGYFMTGHKQTALTSLLINSLLAYATYSSISTKNYGMAILTGIFNLTFYTSNIYGASKSATRYNEQRFEEIINKIQYNSNL